MDENQELEEDVRQLFPQIAWGRDETDNCERGTVGCCIHHVDSDSACETW